MPSIKLDEIVGQHGPRRFVEDDTAASQADDAIDKTGDQLRLVRAESERMFT